MVAGSSIVSSHGLGRTWRVCIIDAHFGRFVLYVETRHDIIAGIILLSPQETDPLIWQCLW